MTGEGALLPITEVATTSEAELLNPVPGRRMELPGFDPEFVDFPDYIVRITDRIWHQRQVDLCLDYYTPDCAIHTLAGDIVGAETVVANTHATLAAFPDRRLEPDNVIWSDDGAAGFYSSHLITSPMTNLGPSEFGPATGRRVRVITIADCACRDNRIYEEWLVRDYAGMALQLGHDPQAVAERQAKADRARGFSLVAHHAALHDSVTRAGSEKSGEPGDPVETPVQWAAHVLQHVWGSDAAERYGAVYDFRAHATYPALASLYGHREISAHHAALFAAVPDAAIRLEHIAAIPYLGGAGHDIAARWTLAGTHADEGTYGPATGRPVVIMGVSHWRVIKGRIAQEVTIWDDIAVRRQLASG